jgi:hypothetical protein
MIGVWSSTFKTYHQDTKNGWIRFLGIPASDKSLRRIPVMNDHDAMISTGPKNTWCLGVLVVQFPAHTIQTFSMERH